MPGKRTQEEESIAIVNFYLSCNSIAETAKQFNKDPGTISRILKKKNTTTSCYLTKEQKEEIIQLYRDGNSHPTIQKMTGHGAGTIHNLVKDLPDKRATTLYGKVITNYFETLSEQAAYFIGLILADGSISDKNHITISLHQQDEDILKEYCNFFHLDHSEIKTFASKPMMRSVRFVNQSTVETLARYGIVPNKAKITSLPQLSEELMPHLIRGIFDGDGHVSKYSTYISGSKQLIEDLDKYLTSIPHYTYYQKDTDVWYIRGEAKLGRKLFLEYIYKNASTYMERKYKSYESFYGPVQ